MRTFTSLGIRFEYVVVGKLPNRRIIRRKIRSCDSGIGTVLSKMNMYYKYQKCKLQITQHGRRNRGAIAPPQYFANQKNEEFKNRST